MSLDLNVVSVVLYKWPSFETTRKPRRRELHGVHGPEDNFARPVVNGAAAISVKVNGSGVARHPEVEWSVIGVAISVHGVFSAVFSNPKRVYLPITSYNTNLRKLSVKASSWCQRLTALMRNHWWNQDSEKLLGWNQHSWTPAVGATRMLLQHGFMAELCHQGSQFTNQKR